MSLARAIATGDTTLLPSRRDEAWRWSDIRGYLRQMPPASPEGAAWAWDEPFAGIAQAEVAVVNGRGPTDLSLEANERRVAAWRFLSATDRTAHAAELWISLAPGAHLTLIESYEGGAVGYVCDTTVHIEIAAGAVLERIVICADEADAVSVSHAEVKLQPGANFSQTVLTSGARRQRIETVVHHPGGGAAVRMDGAYVLGGQRHADITTAVTHEGLDGETSQVVKGVVGGHGRGVFQGRITVAVGADKTDARMRHDALLLSDTAEVDAKPELEIFADDVSCAHGNTVGALDEEAIFYARSRGIPLEAARTLLTGAFVAAVVDRIEHEAVREAARLWVEQRLQLVAP
jgi:Fe-S cluster assembly protein SufD